MAVTVDLTNYNALVNDDGTGNTGTYATKEAILRDAILTPVQAAITALATPVVQTTTSTGTVNDFSLTSRCALLRCNNASLLTITGLAAGDDGQILDIVSVGAGQVDVSNQGGGSSAANRVLSGISCVRSLSPGVGTLRLRYDATTARWRVLQHVQGAPITVAFSAGDYVGVAPMTWTVDAGDVTQYSYLIAGKLMTIWLAVYTSTSGGTAGPYLRVTLPVSAAAVRQCGTPMVYFDSAAGIGLLEVYPGLGILQLMKSTALPNWALVTNTLVVEGSFTFEIG